jgi:hypothetical protein
MGYPVSQRFCIGIDVRERSLEKEEHLFSDQRKEEGKTEERKRRIKGTSDQGHRPDRDHDQRRAKRTEDHRHRSEF